MTLKTIAYRLPQDLIDRIDAHAAMLTRVDGRPCSRSVAIRMLLEQALEKALAPPAAAAEVIEVESEVIETVRSEVIKGNITDRPIEPAQSEQSDESLDKWKGLWGQPQPKKKRPETPKKTKKKTEGTGV